MTAKLWEAIDDDIFVCSQTYSGHSRYIMSVAYRAPTADYPNGMSKCFLLSFEVLSPPEG